MEHAVRELYVDSVEFRYQYDKQLFSGVYFSLKIGDVAGLLGRNGCGKTTLMKIIFGSLRAKFAYIRVNGKKVNCALRTKEVSYLPQDSFLPTSYTVRQMIEYLISQAANRDKIMKVDLIQPILDTRIANISGGELRLLEVLLIMEMPASFVLLDEPFSGLTPIIVETIQQIILEKSQSKGILISDHQYLNVLDVCNQLYLLENGGCRKINNKQELETFYVPDHTFD
ncbi:ATP-binding cassette domain-containing protein [Sphingobacterium sp. HJSM2_6]|uniref:ATP-binding cassette domain-containing protein n=1 Tax=Sphingobacterium sp. HJSM2_6 TaxID=3366264 RepID=UPI003BE2E9F4